MIVFTIITTRSHLPTPVPRRWYTVNFCLKSQINTVVHVEICQQAAWVNAYM